MRTMVVYNPLAGQAETLVRELDAATLVWMQHGWNVDRQPTQGPGDGKRLAQMAVEQGFDAVVAAGGDGTINEVVNGLVGSQTALATLPLGTVNVWARELRMSLQPRIAAEELLKWRVRAIDVGRAGDHHFLLMAGIGFDAAVTALINSQEKRRFGALAYVKRGLAAVVGVRGTRVRLEVDGRIKRRRVLLVVVGNSQLYGGVVKITHRACIDDGLLDVCVIKGDNFASFARNVVAILVRRYTLSPELEYYRARSVKITGRPPLPVQVDGDPIGHTPMTFEVMPGALRALTPVHLPADLVHHVYVEPQNVPELSD